MSQPNNDASITDAKRIEEIAKLRLHEDQVDEILNEYAQKASETFNLPVSLISIVLDEAQIFAASHGLEGWMLDTGGTPVEWSFCANSVKSGEPFIVENAKEHDVVKDNPLVKVDGIQCYAGAPMVTSNNFIIGNFCVIGKEKRTFSEDDIKKLKDFANEAVKRIEERVK
jgi:GAF domain-containing protein